MISMDKDSLICDLAQYYNIYDYRQLPVRLVAVFSYGLPDESRIKRIMSGQNVTLEQQLLAGAYDRLSMLLWTKTKDGMRNVNRPKSVLVALTNTEEKNMKKQILFDSGEDFEKARAELLEKMKGG